MSERRLVRVESGLEPPRPPAVPDREIYHGAETVEPLDYPEPPNVQFSSVYFQLFNCIGFLALSSTLIYEMQTIYPPRIAGRTYTGDKFQQF